MRNKDESSSAEEDNELEPKRKFDQNLVIPKRKKAPANNIITSLMSRIESQGILRPRETIGRSEKRMKNSEKGRDEFYDLDDKFIDDEEEASIDFRQSIISVDETEDALLNYYARYEFVDISEISRKMVRAPAEQPTHIDDDTIMEHLNKITDAYINDEFAEFKEQMLSLVDKMYT